jgi:CheY-like chemotaxis protein
MTDAARIILSVEDNRTNQRLMLRRLRILDAQVVPVHDARSCLEFLARSTPDLILMDIGLPDMDGLSLARTIKDDPRWRHIPIIVVSAHATLEHQASSRELGCMDFFSKPVNFARLMETIRGLLC